MNSCSFSLLKRVLEYNPDKSFSPTQEYHKHAIRCERAIRNWLSKSTDIHWFTEVNTSSAPDEARLLWPRAAEAGVWEEKECRRGAYWRGYGTESEVWDLQAYSNTLPSSLALKTALIKTSR